MKGNLVTSGRETVWNRVEALMHKSEITNSAIALFPAHSRSQARRKSGFL